MTGKAEGACANWMMSLGDSESKEWTAQQGQSRSSKIGTQHHCLPMALTSPDLWGNRDYDL